MSVQTPPTSCVILAGGASRRLQQDKRRLRLHDADERCLLEQTLAHAHACSDDCVVVLNDPEAWPALDARLVCDVRPGAGPLAGMVAGLAYIRHPYALVLACDLPLLRRTLLRALLETPRPYTALIPLRPGATRNQAGIEPLLAIYHRDCLPTFAALLARGERSPAAAASRIAPRWFLPAEWRVYDPDGESFFSVNRPEDLTQLRQRTLG